jgi:hypothetical protein
MSKRYYDGDDGLDAPLSDELVDVLKQPITLEQSQDGQHNPAQLQLDMMDRLNALSSAVLMLSDTVESLRRIMPKPDMYMQPQLLSVTSLSQVDPQALQPQPQLQQVQQLQPQQLQLQQPQVMAVSTASMVAAALDQQGGNPGM